MVKRYNGNANAPQIIFDLDARINEAAHTKQWIGK
jgi:hypothetical protein